MISKYRYNTYINIADYRLLEDGTEMMSTKQDNRSKLKLILVVAVAIMMLFVICGCGANTAAVAGDTSQVTELDTDEEASAPETSDDETPSAEDFLADIPEWNGYAFCYVNGNRPDFEPEEIWTSTQESLDPLDELGRCGTANSCIGQDGMPTGPRGDISSVEPTGWHTDAYDFVEGEKLFNRCHLIAHQLSGDDAVPRNLITGTSYMNRDGMLPFEEAIGAYVRNTGNHVMYRVTPVFVDDELVSRGVHMEAISVEDGGEGLAFNVFCYNVQPGVDIDYKTGDNKLSEDRTMLEDYQAGKFAIIANTLGIVPSEEIPGDVSDEKDTDASETAGDEETEASDEPVQEEHKMTYILNTNTGKFHYPDCRSVKDMKDKNKQEVEATREEVIDRGFSPCGNCHP